MTDSRIPLVFLTAEELAQTPQGPRDALLREGTGADGAGVAWFTLPKANHVLGCACCPPRNAAGQALGRLFLARGRGECCHFNRVLAVLRTEAARQAILAALEGDMLASAAFRLG